MAVTTKVYVRIGGAVGDVGELKYMWRVKPYKIEGIADELGIKDVKDSDRVTSEGYPKPPRIKIAWGKNITVDGKDVFVTEGHRTIFCDTDKYGRLKNGSLRGKKIQVKVNGRKVEKIIGEVTDA